MSGSFEAGRGRPGTGGTTTDEPDHPAVELRAAVVEYENRPDRCTLYDPALTGFERMATWLTADRDVFVDLAAVR
ncbi:hypothetical protein ACFQH6_15300 [Halobacteriaceae archaeon GCM10025711]